MEDMKWEVPEVFLSTVEEKQTRPSPAYWTGVALSGGFWVVFCLQKLDDGASFLAHLGMLLMATVLGFTGWFGVGAAVALVVISFARAMGAW